MIKQGNRAISNSYKKCELDWNILFPASFSLGVSKPHEFVNNFGFFKFSGIRLYYEKYYVNEDVN